MEPLQLPAANTSNKVLTKRKLWDKRPDEKGDDYVCFLAYRNCGPGRSLRRAVREFSKQFPNSQFSAEKYCPRDERGRITPKLTDIVIPPRWIQLSRKYNWPNRATAFDVSTMRLVGAQLVVCQGRALKILAKRVLRAAKKVQLEKSKDIVETMKLIQSYLVPEVVAPVIQSQGDDTAEYEEEIEEEELATA